MNLSSIYTWLLFCTLSILLECIHYTISTSDSQDHDAIFGWIPEHESIISQSDLRFLKEIQYEGTSYIHTSPHDSLHKPTHQPSLEYPPTNEAKKADPTERDQNRKVKTSHGLNIRKVQMKRKDLLKDQETETEEDKAIEIKEGKKASRKEYKNKMQRKYNAKRWRAMSKEDKQKENETRTIRRRIQMEKVREDIVSGNATEQKKIAYQKYAGRKKYSEALDKAKTACYGKA